MSDILDVTKAQARVLRSIAYFEADSGMKGATQYTCSRKVPTGLHVSGSTFNDNIKDLGKNLMVIRIEGKKDGNKETKPYTITDIGQIAWLRHFTLSDNIKIIEKIFSNIELTVVDDIINQIQNPFIKKIKNNFSIKVLKIALNSFHIEEPDTLNMDYSKMGLKETIELSGYYGLVKTSFSRYYDTVHPSLKKSVFKMKGGHFFEGNYDELKISVIDRITFLFYYNLIQTVLDSANAMKIISDVLPMDKKYLQSIPEIIKLTFEISKKKKTIFKIISSNDIIAKIIRDNIEDLQEYKSNDNDFQNISKIFLKS